MTLMQRLFGENPFATRATSQMASLVPVTANFDPTLPAKLGANNPFMIAADTQSKKFSDAYGVNRPLAKPMFLGYRDNKALYGGSRLFILY